jgi:hypothetical protein
MVFSRANGVFARAMQDADVPSLHHFAGFGTIRPSITSCETAPRLPVEFKRVTQRSPLQSSTSWPSTICFAQTVASASLLQTNARKLVIFPSCPMMWHVILLRCDAG